MTDPIYANYWERKRLTAACPAFPVRRWWGTTGLCDIERDYFAAVKDQSSLLDVGAGDLRVMKKLRAAGFRGEYHTQDVGGEYPHTYAALDDVTRTYGAVICFDVIEHLPLAAGLGLVSRLFDLVSPGGVLLLQTPNGRCVRTAFGWDMTHLHLFNLPDLWAYATAAGFACVGYRVWFADRTRNPVTGLRRFAQKVAVTQILGADYADNIALIARKAAV